MGEDFRDLTNPLVNGVFVGDALSGIVDPYSKYFLDAGKYIADLRQTITPELNVTLNQSNNTDYSADMNLSFIELLKQEGINVTVTSSFRKNAKTKQGRTSHHSHYDDWGHPAAIDFRAADGNTDKLLKDIYSNPRIVAWLVTHKKGIIEETNKHPDIRKSTGADKTAKRGDLLHVGPDQLALRMSKAWGVDYNATYNISNNLASSTYSGPKDGKMGSKAFPLGGGKTKIDPNGSYTLFHTFGYGTDKRTKRRGVDCSKKVINTLMGYMDKGCNTLLDLIMMYHLGMSGSWDSVKDRIRQKGGLRDQGSGRWISADQWIKMQEAYLKQCADYMHMPITTRVSKTRDFLYPLVTFISRQEQGVNSEAATAIALQEMRIA